MSENKIIKLSERDHVLQRPNHYIGSTKPITRAAFFFENGRFVYKEYTCVEGLVKIINEVIDNSVDEAIRTSFKTANVIKVYIDEDDTVRVIDNGRGIPVERESQTNEWGPVLAFTHARAGANFDDKERQGIGMNGLGSFCTNCFSKKFHVDTRDGKKRLRLTCEDNLSTIDTKIDDDAGARGTSVIFKPDLQRFGMTKIDDVHRSMVEQRMIHLAMCFPLIKFKYNGDLIKIRNFKSYAEAFNPVHELVQTNRYSIAVMPNDTDDFRHVTFVNGLDIKNGGNHVDHISWEIVSRLRAKISKKYKQIKPGDIKNKMQIVAIFRDFPALEFDSQTKERLTNDVQTIKDYLGDIDWDRLANRLYSTEAFIDPIVETYKIKEELKKRQEAKDLNKKLLRTKVRSEKYLPPIKEQKYLFLCEGDSAVGGVMPALGRESIGYFAMRGVPLNTYEATHNKVLSNNEFNTIVQILGIELGCGTQEMTFSNVVLAQDADNDGSHIAGLIIGFFKKHMMSVLDEGKLKKFRTPVIALKQKNKIVNYFFTLQDFARWKEKNDQSKYSVKYFKGLGTWNMDELKQLVDQHGLDHFIETLAYDGTDADGLIHSWLSGSKSDDRKEFIKACRCDIFNV